MAYEQQTRHIFIDEDQDILVVEEAGGVYTEKSGRDAVVFTIDGSSVVLDREMAVLLLQVLGEVFGELP